MRQEIDYIVQTLTGDAVSGAAVLVKLRNSDGSSGATATVFSTPDTGDILANPLTTTPSGRIDGWLDPGIYNLEISGTGILSFTQPYNVSGFTLNGIGADGTQLVADSTTSIGYKWLARESIFIDAPPFNALADGATDNTTIFTAAINALPLAGGTIQLGPGIYRGRFIIPQNKLVVIKGSGMDSTGGVYGTKIKRPIGSTSPVIDAQGAVGSRCYLELWDVVIDGDTANGDVVSLLHVTDVYTQRVRIKLGAQKGLHGTELYNCHFNNTFISNCGSGTTHPAMQIDAASDNGVFGGSNGVYWTDCEFEGNSGTDVRIDGDSGTGSVSSGFRFENCKIETQDPGSYPLISLGYASRLTWAGGNLYLGQGTHKIYDQTFTTAGLVPLSFFDDVTFDSGTPWTGTTYVEHTEGIVGMSNVRFAGHDPSDAYYHIGVNVALDGMRLKNAFFLNASKRFHDDRVNGTAGKDSRTLSNWKTSGATASELATSQIAVWNLRDAQTDIISGIIRVPSNALVNRNPVLRATVSSTSPGTVRTQFATQSRTVGDASNIASSNVTQDTVITANTITEITAQIGVQLKPGDELPVRLFRDGTHVNDTLAADLSIHSIDVLYEVAL